MGSTVTCGKLVAGYKNRRGETIYVLFEQTYEKNCYPHIPNWSCIYLGPIDGALRRIFISASACEGGMLQNRNGYITPEGYVDGWMKAFSSVYPIHDVPIELSVGTNFYAPVPEGAKAKVQAILRRHGQEKICALLDAGESYFLSLFRDSDFIVELTSGTLPPWRLIRHSDMPKIALADPVLAFVPGQAKSDAVVSPSFYCVGHRRYVALGDDGMWRYKGEPWEIVQSFVMAFSSQPLEHTSRFKSNLKALRLALENAPQVPDGAVVVVDRTVPLDHDSQQRHIDEIEVAFKGVKTSTGFEFPAPTGEREIWELARLPDGVATWRIPSPPVETHKGQLDLLVA